MAAPTQKYPWHRVFCLCNPRQPHLPTGSMSLQHSFIAEFPGSNADACKARACGSTAPTRRVLGTETRWEVIMALKITRRGFIASGAATTAFSGPDSGWAQTWPSKPIKIVCAYPAGGLTDSSARVYGEYLSRKLGQPVIVENKAGASGSIGAAAVKQSPPDGYTLLVATTAALAQNRVLLKSLPYDPDRDFVLISSMSAGHLPLVAGKATNVTNLKELIDYARKNDTNVGTWGPGSYAHIVVAELNKRYELQMKAVHYRGE